MTSFKGENPRKKKYSVYFIFKFKELFRRPVPDKTTVITILRSREDSFKFY